MKSLRRQPGFSLTEMLVAVAILLVLMGALLAFGRHLRRQSQETLCRSTIDVLVAAIEQYHDFYDAFPNPGANLYAQLYALPKSRAVCEKMQKSLTGDTDGDGATEFLDPWGTPLDYQYVPGQAFPTVVSAGADKRLGTADDIKSE